MYIIKISKAFNNYFPTPVLVSAIISVIFGAVTTQFSSTGTISIGIFSISLCISFFIIWLLLIIVFSKFESKNISFEILKFRSYNNERFCILKPCEYLSYGAYITIFYLEDNFETYFATGIINNIQNDKLIQVKLLHTISNNEQLLNKALNNNISILNSIIIKPIITNNYIQGSVENYE